MQDDPLLANFSMLIKTIPPWLPSSKRKPSWATCAVYGFMVGVGIGFSLHSEAYFLTQGLRRETLVKMEPDRHSLEAVRTKEDSIHDKAWCPKAECENSDLCKPCQRRFLFVVSTGRSASTTLTYMLDALPGLRMSGENNDELRAIRKMMDNVILDKTWRAGTGKKCAWGHNLAPPGAFSCVAHHMIETMNPPLTDSSGKVLEDDSETIVGMKTIRFVGNDDEETAMLVEWVKAVFPCARIVVNFCSDTEKMAISQQKRFPGGRDRDVKELQEDLEKQIENFAKLQSCLESKPMYWIALFG